MKKIHTFQHTWKRRRGSAQRSPVVKSRCSRAWTHYDKHPQECRDLEFPPKYPYYKRPKRTLRSAALR